MKKFVLIAICFLFGIGFSFAQKTGMNVLVFTKTMGYYHESKPNALKAFYEMAHKNKWQITFTEDSTLFTDNELKKYQVVVFLLTTGNNLLNPEEKTAFEHYIQNGGGFVGVHTATDTEYNWPFYVQMVGGHFIGHPPVHEEKLIIENKDYAATSCFGVDSLKWKDEFYSFDRNPRNNKNIKVLISIDEKGNYNGENAWSKKPEIAMGDHPLVWCQEFNGGRCFQTALGHIPAMYDEEVFRNHLTGAVLWAAGKK